MKVSPTLTSYLQVGPLLLVLLLMLLVVLLIPMFYYVISTARASREYA